MPSFAVVSTSGELLGIRDELKGSLRSGRNGCREVAEKGVEGDDVRG